MLRDLRDKAGVYAVVIGSDGRSTTFLSFCLYGFGFPRVWDCFACLFVYLGRWMEGYGIWDMQLVTFVLLLLGVNVVDLEVKKRRVFPVYLNNSLS